MQGLGVRNLRTMVLGLNAKMLAEKLNINETVVTDILVVARSARQEEQEKAASYVHSAGSSVSASPHCSALPPASSANQSANKRVRLHLHGAAAIWKRSADFTN